MKPVLSLHRVGWICRSIKPEVCGFGATPKLAYSDWVLNCYTYNLLRNSIVRGTKNETV